MADDNIVNVINVEMHLDNNMDEVDVNENARTFDSGTLESKPKSTYKLTSDVWQHFSKRVRQITRNGKTEKKQESVCNYCKGVLAYSSKNGTSSMRKHLERCTTYRRSGPNGQEKKQKLLTMLSPLGSDATQASGLSAWKFNQATNRRTCAEMIILDEQPFKLVENVGFRRYISSIQPLVKFVSRTTVVKDCIAVYEREKKELLNFFKDKIQRVCLTTDLWTSITNEGYFCLTTHFVDDNWKLQSKIVNFCRLPPPHNGESIAQAIEDCLLKWEFNGICSITVDNTSTNDVAVRSLKRRLAKRNLLIGDGETLHVRCAAHIINLIVRDGINEIQDSISRVRDSMKYVRGSPTRKSKFKECCEKEKVMEKCGLCVDVPTRWNSTYFMLDNAIKFQKAFEHLANVDPIFAHEGPPTEDDWDIANVLCIFLKKFYEITNLLSGTSYVTSNIYLVQLFEIETILVNSSTSENQLLRDMSKRMREKFDKYWGNIERINLILLVANVLDPRYKLKFLKFFYSTFFDQRKVVETIEKVKNDFIKLFKIYEARYSSTHITSLKGESSQVIMKENTTYQFHKFCDVEEEEEVQTEIDRYLEEKIEKEIENFDVLKWWSVHSSRYRVLSHMARDILAIPVTTVVSESTFSTSGCVLDEYRSSLADDTLEALICTQNWMRMELKLTGVEEILEDDDAKGEKRNDDQSSAASTIPDNKGKGILYE